MSNSNSNIPEQYFTNLLSTIIDEHHLFSNEEMEEIKPVIERKHPSDLSLLKKISKHESLRKHLCSQKCFELFINFYSVVSEKGEINESIREVISTASEFENEYFSTSACNDSFVLIASMLTNFRKMLDNSNNLEIDKGISDLFKFFSKALDNVELIEETRLSFEKMYDVISKYFSENDFAYSYYYFSFLYELTIKSPDEFLSKSKDEIRNFFDLRSFVEIDKAVSREYSIANILKNKNFKDNFLNRTKVDSGFLIEIYSNLIDNDKTQALLNWLPINSGRSVKDLVDLIEKIGDEISGRLSLAEAFLNEAKRLGGLDDKKGLFSLFFKMSDSHEKKLIEDYKAQVKDLYASENFEIHKAGLEQVEMHRELFAKDEKSDLNTFALTRCLENIDSSFPVIESILRGKEINKQIINEIWINPIHQSRILEFFKKYKSQSFLLNFFNKLERKNQEDISSKFIDILYDLQISGEDIKTFVFDSLMIMEKSFVDQVIQNTKDKLSVLLDYLLNGQKDDRIIEFVYKLNSAIWKDHFPSIAGVDLLWSIFSSKETSPNTKLLLDGFFKEQSKIKLEIKEAIYFTDSQSIDVTEELKKMLKGNVLLFKATNSIAGDPHHGVQKKLRIKYRINKTEKEKTVVEDEIVYISV